jgi:hypothetical protein
MLRSVLAGQEELFARTSVDWWRAAAQSVAAERSPSAIARAYKDMSRGSAPGTFHDLIISVRNGHPITPDQEPFVNELLTTFESIGRAASDAILADGDDATLGSSAADAAADYAFSRGNPDAPRRWHIVSTGIRCTTCNSRFQLDDAPDSVAARRWSLTTGPDWIEQRRSQDLVDAAMGPQGHEETRLQLDAVRPAFDRLGLPVIRLPYNLPDRGPNDRCRVCGSDAWTTIHWLVLDDPLRLEPLGD